MKKITHKEDVNKLRKQSYPPIEEFIDGMYWASKGDESKLKIYYQKCEEVKKKYPKSG